MRAARLFVNCAARLENVGRPRWPIRAVHQAEFIVFG